MEIRKLTALYLAASAALTMLTACASTQSSATPDRPPNILLILADDLGPGDLGIYGQSRIRTPRLDALAHRGTRFTNFYSGSPVCAPSRCTLLTGLHSGHAAIRDNKELQPEGQHPLPAQSITIAEMLKDRGYATAAIGKWGLGPPGSSGDPLSQGFDHFFGYNCQRHAHNHFPTWLYQDRTRLDLPAGTYAPDLFRDRAASFIRENSDRPFFLFFATTVPHLALQVPEDSLAEYKGRLADSPYDGKKGYRAHPTPHAAYAAMVTRMDRDIGSLLDLLSELHLEDDTLVIFTSDNGPTFDIGGADTPFFNSAAGLRGFKGSLQEGGIRVPMIASLPGRVRADAVVESPAAMWDLVPTIAEFTAANHPQQLDGISLAGALQSTAPLPAREALYWEFPQGRGSQAVRMGKWKAIRRAAKDSALSTEFKLELYDLAADPAERNDISADHPEVITQARALMRRRASSPVAEWDLP